MQPCRTPPTLEWQGEGPCVRVGQEALGRRVVVVLLMLHWPAPVQSGFVISVFVVVFVDVQSIHDDNLMYKQQHQVQRQLQQSNNYNSNITHTIYN